MATYLIYNPATEASALLAVNATSAVAPEVYGGANMPAGYTVSALVSVWRTASSQFVVGYQDGRQVETPYVLTGNTTTQITTMTPLSISAVVPFNARSVSGFMTIGTLQSTNGVTAVSNSSTGIGQIQVSGNGNTSGSSSITGAPFHGVKLIARQTLFWQSSVATGTFMSGGVYLSGYEF